MKCARCGLWTHWSMLGMRIHRKTCNVRQDAPQTRLSCDPCCSDADREEWSRNHASISYVLKLTNSDPELTHNLLAYKMTAELTPRGDLIHPSRANRNKMKEADQNRRERIKPNP